MSDVNSYNITCSSKGSVNIISLAGCLEKIFADKFLQVIDERLLQGARSFVIDMTKVDLIESPGVAGLITATEKITDDFHGSIVYCNMKPMHQKVLELVGIFMYASFCETLNDAVDESKA